MSNIERLQSENSRYSSAPNPHGGADFRVDTTGISREQEPREHFELVYGPTRVGQRERVNEDGSHTTVQAYELRIPRASMGRAVVDFNLSAEAAGYAEVRSPVVIPEVGQTTFEEEVYVEGEGQRALRQPCPADMVLFFVAKPNVPST